MDSCLTDHVAEPPALHIVKKLLPMLFNTSCLFILIYVQLISVR